jgi:hypothetical protein
MLPLELKIGPDPIGFKLGNNHGFTQAGAIGPPAPSEMLTPDGL